MKQENYKVIAEIMGYADCRNTYERLLVNELSVKLANYFEKENKQWTKSSGKDHFIRKQFLEDCGVEE